NAREGLTNYTSIFADRHTACPCEGRNVRELRRELVLITERRYCEDIRNPEDRSERRDDDPTARVRHAQRAAGPQVNGREHREDSRGRRSCSRTRLPPHRYRAELRERPGCREGRRSVGDPA